MPVYEYACDKCGHEFEAEQRITEPPLKTCPRCRARKLKRLISQTSFVLKGSGWYADLYSSKAKPDSGEAKSDAAASKSESAGDGASSPAAGGSDATPPSDPKPKKKREGKPGKSKGSKAAA
jgi:putative FmdB family regulatory protein